MRPARNTYPTRVHTLHYYVRPPGPPYPFLTFYPKRLPSAPKDTIFLTNSLDLSSKNSLNSFGSENAVIGIGTKLEVEEGSIIEDETLIR